MAGAQGPAAPGRMWRGLPGRGEWTKFMTGQFRTRGHPQAEGVGGAFTQKLWLESEQLGLWGTGNAPRCSVMTHVGAEFACFADSLCGTAGVITTL